ncbi:MAG: putative 2-aminoethylphosphonate ABC transporter ATP-binding protein [Cyclobacteriaceae bacterium]|nr:putative 2-aminoethylphosphonate ABC transporter ATP-binding protein [Cyclobacteriaceae bacterium]
MSDKQNNYLVIEDLSKRFGDFVALKDVNLNIVEGEFVCFLGPSGCGKTTLLRAIAGLDLQSSGRIFQAGKDVSVLPPAERDFGIVFQSYALFPNLTVEKNVAYGLENRKTPKDQIKERVAELLELVGLSDKTQSYPSNLSGGQQQRVALARALATSPSLLLLDEPLSALDAKVRAFLRHEIKQLQRKLGVTTVMVTHDQEEALTMADRIVVIKDGYVEQIGTPNEIYQQPQTKFVADFIGTMNFFKAQVIENDGVKIDELIFKLETDSEYFKGDQVIAAIRPEEFIITDASNKSAFETRIEEIEFLGNFVRVLLSCDQMPGQTFVISVEERIFRLHALEEGQVIHVNALVSPRLYPL